MSITRSANSTRSIKINNSIFDVLFPLLFEILQLSGNKMRKTIHKHIKRDFYQMTVLKLFKRTFKFAKAVIQFFQFADRFRMKRFV